MSDTDETVPCRACGETIAAGSRFCEHCGVEKRPSAPAFAKRLGELRAMERVEEIAPGAGDVASQLMTQLRTPSVAMALAGGSLAALATFGIGVVLALVLSDQSAVGLVDHGKGVVTAGFAQMLNFVQVSYGSGVGKLGPALFVVFPIGACAVAAAGQAHRTLGLSPLARFGGGVGVGVVFGLLMLIPALGAGGLGGGPSAPEASALGAVALGALWGAIGGLLGTYYVVRTALRPGFLSSLVPGWARETLRLSYLALRPLAILLALMTLAGTFTWTVETLLKSNLRDGNSTPVATIDHAAYALEHGLHWTELAGLAQFRLPVEGVSTSAVPVPIGDVSKIKFDSSGHYRLFSLGHAMPAYTFVPLAIFLLGAALLLALSAGFAVAQARASSVPWAAAAWGSLVGPIWSIALVIANALIAKDFFGRANGDSVFGVFLLAGLVLGAVGGLLSLQSERRRGLIASTASGAAEQP